MSRREQPAAVHEPRRSAREHAGRRPPAPDQAGRCFGAAAQLAAVHSTLRRGAAVQLKAGGAAAEARPTTAPRPAAANRTGLPDRLKAGVEALSGVSLDGVKVHYNSAKPAQLNALAYAQGSDIHLAPGQEKHLPHEAWHVVQQAQGRVKPTMQLKGGALVNDEIGLEREADLFGAKALAVAAAAPSAEAPALPQGRLAPVQRRGSGAVIQAALVNPVYAGGTKPTTVSLTLGVGDWPPLGSAPGAASPDGWPQIVALGLSAGWVRFHVFNREAGGAGVANNLLPTTQQINQCAAWKGFEKWVKLFSQPALAGVGMPFASTFNAAVAYHTAAEDCVYRNAAGNLVPVRGADFPAVIVATLDVPGGGGLAARQYASNLGIADGLLRPNQFAPPGWALVVAPAPAVAPVPAVAAAAPAAAPAGAAAPAAVPVQMKEGVPINDDAGLEREADMMAEALSHDRVDRPRPVPLQCQRIPGAIVQREVIVDAMFTANTGIIEQYLDRLTGLTAVVSAIERHPLNALMKVDIYIEGGEQTQETKTGSTAVQIIDGKKIESPFHEVPMTKTLVAARNMTIRIKLNVAPVEYAKFEDDPAYDNPETTGEMIATLMHEVYLHVIPTMNHMVALKQEGTGKVSSITPQSLANELKVLQVAMTRVMGAEDTEQVQHETASSWDAVLAGVKRVFEQLKDSDKKADWELGLHTVLSAVNDVMTHMAPDPASLEIPNLTPDMDIQEKARLYKQADQLAYAVKDLFYKKFPEDSDSSSSSDDDD